MQLEPEKYRKTLNTSISIPCNVATDSAFRDLTGHDPFPWQRELYHRLTRGDVPRWCDIPTGLGKTAVVAIWLIAFAYHPKKIRRRLVYVVNRRTVVDQTTNEAMKLRENAPKIGIDSLAISTLRGQFADNQELSADPSRPAIICGTVDMIGSRLLFSGYRVGFKAKPLHAGFLGQDVLLVHDEAHLEPAFQKLVEDIEREQTERERTGELPWPKLRVMALSATARGANGNAQAEECKPFELTDQEKQPLDVIPDPPTEPLHHVWRRLKAKKSLRLQKVAGGKVAEEIAKIALEQYKDAPAAVLIYVRTIDDVLKVCDKLTHKKTGVSKDDVQQLTGTMRGLERDRMANPRRADACRIFARFLKPPRPDADEHERWKIEPMPGTVYLVCTSAGEVGIDISADHMVCDLSTFESMAQRLGRVNRFGEGDARIDVLYPAEFDKKDKLSPARENALKLLEQLPALPQLADQLGVPRYDASPKALAKLKSRSDLPYKIADAFSPTPTILPATDILFDAWALTTIRDKMPGRPPVAPYLHGVAEWQPFETHVAWREEVEVLASAELRERYEPVDLLEDYPLKPHELLRDATDRKRSGVFAQLTKIAARHPDASVWIIDSRGQITPTTLRTMINGGNAALHDATVLLPPRVGGLSKSGTLEGDADHDDALQYDVADEWYEDKERTIKRRIRLRAESREPVAPKDMRCVRIIDTDPAADEMDAGQPMPNRFWHWYTRPRSADDDLSRSSNKPVEWGIHVEDAVRQADRILAGLSLPEDVAQAVRVAAKLHDHGKRRSQFQFTLGNRAYPRLVLAKSGRSGAKLPETYRHEFGSLADAMEDAEFQQLSSEMQDLVLHLIAAGHGRARPHFPPDEAFDPERSQRDGEAMVGEVPRRFARLQRKYGRWGLAYLESLLRAADWAASAEPSEFVTETKEVSR
jgi:CRISPR-associated endonuclease/helicase Cas3